jgi:hypothetical protein
MGEAFICGGSASGLISMADEKTPQFEETKWWIDRGPVKEREKPTVPVKGIVEKWAYELLKGSTKTWR